MIRKIMIILLLATLCSSTANATEARKGGNKWKTIMTIVGTGGGFVLGTFVGLSAYDDAIDSERKVWTTATLISIAGGTAGFFLGRHMDRGRGVQETRIMPEIRWEAAPEIQNVSTQNRSILLRDADPIELLSRK